ncbi:hypothetical protein FOCC_FOCC017552 [Frankliniella occidentalis]|nr:hypothetical protein FOCC_FOCC017552 [Frankliniella occidentalis]
MPRLLAGPHPTLTSASAALEERVDAKRGRHLVAAQNIPADCGGRCAFAGRKRHHRGAAVRLVLGTGGDGDTLSALLQPGPGAPALSALQQRE